MKRKLALFAAILFLLGTFAGCAQSAVGASSGTTATTAAGTTTAAVTTAATTASSAVEVTTAVENQEITQLLFVNTLFTIAETDLQTFYESPVYDKLRTETGVELLMRGADTDQATIYLASGDLGDITNIRTQADIQSVVESETILPLNDLVEQYGPNVTAYRPERWKMATNQLSVDGSGTAYVLPIRAGAEGYNYYPGHNLFYIRWDLYSKMGYPEVRNESDFLNVLADMYQENQTTAEGLSTYGVGFYATNTDLMGFWGRFVHTYGYRNLGATGFLFDVDNDGALINAFTNPIETFSGSDEPLYFAAAKYYNQAYRMGLLDQDSFTQQAADYAGKCTNGQYLSGWWRSQADSYVQNVLKTDPDSEIGFEVIPIEGITLWTNSVQAAGWENYYLAIPASAKDPVKSMQFINYCFSPEGCRLLFSGIEGEHWNVVDGEAIWTDEVIAAKNKGGEDWASLGIAYGPALYLLGLGNKESFEEDGSPLDLSKGDNFLSRCLKPVDKAYCEKYDVSYPIQLFLNMKEEGKANTHENLDMRIVSSMGSAPDDITLLNSSILKTAAEAIPALVMAESDEEFAEQKQALMSSLESIGLQSVIDWYEARHEEVLASFSY